jgi:hypothetical protein
MKFAHKHCIDCGSEGVETTIDEVKPVYRMEIVNFSCGAVLRNTFSANGNVGKVVHSGYRSENSQYPVIL